MTSIEKIIKRSNLDHGPRFIEKGVNRIWEPETDYERWLFFAMFMGVSIR